MITNQSGKYERLQGLWRFIICISLFQLIQIETSMAQDTCVISGRLVDSVTLKPLENVIITLWQNSKSMQNTSTNALGTFRFSKLSPGNYAINVEGLYYQPKKMAVTLSKAIGREDLGDIKISVKDNNLKEVAIIAQSLVSRSVDRLTYSVEKDPQSSTTSVLNIISKVPLLSLDPNNNIKLQGESNYRILIDGKPSVLLANNASEVLRNMSASTIKSIEVITSPSGKYLVEGVSGVINIITKKRIENGYEGTIFSQFKTPAGGVGAGLTQTLKLGKFVVTGYNSYTEYDIPFTSTALSRQSSSPGNIHLKQEGEKHAVTKTDIISTDLSYDIDSLNLLTFHVARYNQKARNESNFMTVTNDSDGGLQQYNTENQNRNSLQDFELALNYQKQSAKDKSRIFTLSYLYLKTDADLNNSNSFSNTINITEGNYVQSNSSNNSEHSLQADLDHAYKKLKINSGIKGVIRLGDSKNISSTSFSDFYDYQNTQYLFFAYNSYQIALKDWEFLGGYRLEFVRSKNQFGNSEPASLKDYAYLLPNLTVNYKINNYHALNLSFNQNVQRPNISYLNPFIDRSNPNLETAGNPDLDPVKNSRFNLQYSRFKKSTLVLSLAYAFSNNQIQQIYSVTDTSSVARLTYDNVSKIKNLSLNLSYNLSLTKKMNLNVSGNGAYTRLAGMTDSIREIVKQSAVLGEVNVGVNYSFADDFQVNGRFAYTSPAIFLQGRTTSYPILILGGSKQLFEKRLSLGFSMMNPFTKYRYIDNIFSGTSFKQESRTQVYNRSFSIQAAFKFGQIKGSIRTNSKGINNDDTIKR
jgi:outer membrane receptor protein involved in Fe transport